MNPANPGMGSHKLTKARDKNSRSGRVIADIRRIVTREALAKHRTGSADYRAVDLDYESRKEIIPVAKNFGAQS